MSEPRSTCRKCGNVIIRTGGGWTHADRTLNIDHGARPPRGQSKPPK